MSTNILKNLGTSFNFRFAGDPDTFDSIVAENSSIENIRKQSICKGTKGKHFQFRIMPYLYVTKAPFNVKFKVYFYAYRY